MSLGILIEPAGSVRLCEGKGISGGVGKSWKWILATDLGFRPWARCLAWRLWVAEPMKWTGRPREERTTASWRRRSRWLWAGKGTMTIAIWESSIFFKVGGK